MKKLDHAILEKVNLWLAGNYDEKSKRYIQKLIDTRAYAALTDIFYKDLEFGTGGLRGIMGPGPNRVNQYTIGTATQGFSNYLKKKYPEEIIHVAVAYDSRNEAHFFAQITADIFSANGIIVHLFRELHPTPTLSFAVRTLACHGGVVITASHNPKEYNGYKVYGSDGGQLIAPDDAQIMQEIVKLRNSDEIRFERIDENIKMIDADLDNLYLDQIYQLSIHRDAIYRQRNLKIVYSPIHGTGITLVPQALKRFGFENIILVEEQIKPDGDFPTVIYPNPEEKEALTLALKKAQATDADLVLATDPDADRVGIAIRDHDHEFIILNGNQIAGLLFHYLLSAWEVTGRLTGKEYIATTIVTTPLIDAIACSKNVLCYHTLTGFKFIGALITALETTKTFIVGGEESYGYLIGELVRDKDAIISCAFIAEMTAFYKDQGISLYDALLTIYQQHGLYQEKLISITKEGKSGLEEISNLMYNFRKQPPSHLGASRVIKLKDYVSSQEIDLLTGITQPLDFPKSDVLQFIMEDASILSVRPSGTEPKIKFYCSVRTDLPEKSMFKAKREILDRKIAAIMQDLAV